MNIKEYWAKLVASGLAPDWDDVWVIPLTHPTQIILAPVSNLEQILSTYIENIRISSSICDEFDNTIQLRKDGIDLYKLEWQKPTEDFEEAYK